MAREKRICDRCNEFEVTPCGMTEICHAQKDGSQVIPKMTKDYIEDRISGEKQNCKSFKKIVIYF